MARRTSFGGGRVRLPSPAARLENEITLIIAHCLRLIKIKWLEWDLCILSLSEFSCRNLLSMFSIDEKRFMVPSLESTWPGSIRRQDKPRSEGTWMLLTWRRLSQHSMSHEMQDYVQKIAEGQHMHLSSDWQVGYQSETNHVLAEQLCFTNTTSWAYASRYKTAVQNLNLTLMLTTREIDPIGRYIPNSLNFHREPRDGFIAGLLSPLLPNTIQRKQGTRTARRGQHR